VRGSDATASSHASADLSPTREEMLEDVVSGLRSAPKTLPSKYFYDEVGSDLFDRITELDEYYLTRTETGIMRRHAPEIVRALGPNVLLIEPGAGSGAKTRILLEQMQNLAAYVPIDISGEHLAGAAERLRRDHPGVRILPLVADFTRSVTLPKPPPATTRRVVYFPGSTIGNFRPLEAVRLLGRIRSLAGRGGAVLIGFDMVKPRHLLYAAYNDRRGVTARFNLNVLARINRELEGTFDLDAFEHDAPFNERASRVEMHLVSKRRQTVRVADESFDFDCGESILTEYSHKYTPDSFAELARSAGLQSARSWTDADGAFCVQLLEPIPEIS